MKILAIDTSGVHACAAIVDNYIVIGEIMLNARTGEKSWAHSEILMPGVDQLFKLTGINSSDLDYIAYTAGPGSFTGLRIGASCALGLAKGINRPTIAVPTLDSLAYNMQGVGCNNLIIPMMDARRGQVYSALYRRDEMGKVTRITDYLALPVEELLDFCSSEFNADSCSEPHFVDIPDQDRKYARACTSISQSQDNIPIFLGDGACAYKEVITSILPRVIFAPPNNNRQRASSAAIWALEQISAGFTPGDNVEIMYVRAPQAVRDKQI